MNNIKVTVEKDGRKRTYEGEFAVLGIVRGEEEEKVITVAPFGSTTAYGATMLGCQVAAKLIVPFDTMERISAGDEV